MKPLVVQVDGALPPAVFGAVVRSVRALGETGLRHTYQTTFWFPRGASSSNVVEDAIVALEPLLPRRYAGAEWWLSRMRTSNVRVDFHRDCDERLLRAGGPERRPARSSVLFLNRCTGGLLVVTRQPPNPGNPSLSPDHLSGDLVEPAPNRYVHFAGALTHGVLDARNQVPGARLPRQPRLRLAVVVNWWNQRPTAVPRFGEVKLYRALAKQQPNTL